MALRVSLTERISIEASGVVVDEHRFPGRQGRLVFAYLLAAQGRPVPRDELAEALWGDGLPAKWEKALSVLVSKLRALLNECGIDGAETLTSAFGCYELTLPAESWVDVAAADDAARAATHSLAAGDPAAARDNAETAASLARRTFLPGEDGRWVVERRAELREVLVRALECLADAGRRSGDAAASVRAADELIALEPFRESGYRQLMLAQSAAGNDAEALRTYERCRSLLAEELGAYPSPETETIYLDILRSEPKGTAIEVEATNGDGSRDLPPPDSFDRLRHRKLAAGLVVAAILTAAVTVAAVLLDRGEAAVPLVVPPTAIVRIDPDTLEPTQAMRIGPRADIVVAAGGYVWVTHGVFRYVGSDTVRNAGDRVLTRVDPSTGESVVVGGGLAPCGLTADPSGDVWVANCFASGPHANVVRVDAETLAFERTISVPAGIGYFKGIVYGGGSLWVADASGGAFDYRGVTEVDPRSGAKRSIVLDRHAGWLAWAEGYGDLWMNDFGRGSVSRLRAETEEVENYDPVGIAPASHVVLGDTVWIGDWNQPAVFRIPATGPGSPRQLSLPVTAIAASGVTGIAAGAGAVWATVPDDRAVWRIDPKTDKATRIELPYYPWGVAATDDAVWVSLRARDA